MKVLFLQGSPRRDGNTETLCRHMADTMKAKGGDVQITMIRLADLSVGGCTECFACQRTPDVPGCSVADDMQGVYDAVLSADLVVPATPVFCWGMTAQLKAAIDRFYAFCKFAVMESGRFKCLVDGKRAALVVTAGGGPYDGAEVCVASYRAMTTFLRMDSRGEFVAAPVGEPATVRADTALLARAEQFATQVIA